MRRGPLLEMRARCRSGAAIQWKTCCCGVEAGNLLFEQATYGSVVSDNFGEDIHSLYCFFFKIADDGDFLPVAGEDERGRPGEVVVADEEIERGVAYAARLTDEGQPHIGLLLFEDFNGLVYFFFDEGHGLGTPWFGIGTMDD